MKILQKHLCANCENNTYYLEFDSNWHGLNVMKYTCTKCGCSPVWSQVTDVAKFIEAEDIRKELKKTRKDNL